MKWALSLVLSFSGCSYIHPPEPITLPLASNGFHTLTCRSNALRLTVVVDGRKGEMAHLIDDWWEGHIEARDGSTVYFESGRLRTKLQRINIVSREVQ